MEKVFSFVKFDEFWKAIVSPQTLIVRMLELHVQECSHDRCFIGNAFYRLVFIVSVLAIIFYHF